MYHSEGGTNTAEALEFVGSNSFQAVNGGRRDANRTVVLLTDGESANPTNTVHQAELLKASKNVQIFALGIGTAVSGGNNEIRGIASDPDSYFVQNVDSFLYLCNLVPAMVPKLGRYLICGYSSNTNCYNFSPFGDFSTVYVRPSINDTSRLDP